MLQKTVDGRKEVRKCGINTKFGAWGRVVVCFAGWWMVYSMVDGLLDGERFARWWTVCSMVDGLLDGGRFAR
ncbi:hypothetical protein BDV95DRAFT_85797 [Massariosphaeria phaeospora]|uniref:Transmembrane protein n=1 Tax=Massariosphaeria phaeospora TaxID=100035 RepID=A0A7C8I3A5_9PLEO|nr:hypothetical protein BDV95DRAFT_85797 [Massariosphaeria phaeospora]